MSETRRLCGVPSEREECCRLDSQGYTLRWYAMPFQGMGFATGLGHGIGIEIEIEIGNRSTLRQNGIEPDKKRSERRSAPRPGSATHGYKRSEDETTTQVC